MTDTDTVERVAKAVFSASTFFGKWEDQPQSNREVCVDMARAAIAALPPAVPEHSDDFAVRKFSEMMAKKMKTSREKGRNGWDDPERCSVEYLRELLNEHVAKGDPVDVANICMMLHHYKASTAPTAPDPVAEVQVPAIPKPNYVQTKPNQWVWNVCEGYEVIITKALGGDRDWSFRVNNLGRCFLTSKEVAEDMALDALNERIIQDTLTLNLLSKGLRALTKDGEAG